MTNGSLGQRQTPAIRNVFDFAQPHCAGCRLSDPDYVSEDEPRFRWAARGGPGNEEKQSSTREGTMTDVAPTNISRTANVGAEGRAAFDVIGAI